MLINAPQSIGAGIILLLALQVGSVFAWAAPGHQVAALLAYRQLSPQQQQHAVEILRHLPSFSYDIGRETANLPPAEQNEQIFLLASTWPDLVRPTTHPAFLESRPGWHVTWLPISLPGYRLPKKLPKAGDTNTMDILPVLMHDFATSTGLSEERRAVDLAWILHLIGDLHQPLHAIAYFSKEFPAGDDSGGLFYVRPREDEPPTALHKVWDGLFGHHDEPTTGIVASVDSITSDPRLSRRALKQALTKKTAVDWIEESREIARREAYLLDTKSPLQGVHKHRVTEMQAKGEAVPVLPDGYIAHAKKIARQREALAGDRIADYLRSCL
jgi:hypothetical protein